MSQKMEITIFLLFCHFFGSSMTSLSSNSGVFRMSQNNLNNAKFFELRRSPQKNISFEKAPTNITPTVICTPDTIGIALNENFADIRIFASEHSKIQECSRRFSLEMDPEFVTNLHGPCGVRRVFKGIPSTSIAYSIRLIISHSVDQITEFDKIYDVTCTTHLKTAEARTSLEIIQPPIYSISSENDEKVTPKCKYSLHFDGLEGPRTEKAHVGELIYHRWKCTPSPSDYIFKVYSCFVEDENNQKYMIIDENGCSMDEEIIPTPEYDLENGIIYTPSRAFRFANSNHVHFKCMISVCQSTSNPECRRNLPPKCKKVQIPRKPRDLSIEDRLWRIQKLMTSSSSQNTSGNSSQILKNSQNFSKFSKNSPNFLEVKTPTLRVERRTNDHQNLSNLLRTYQIWTWILCALNVLLVLLCVIITFRLLKNKYIMDIKDRTNTVFRRVPF